MSRTQIRLGLVFQGGVSLAVWMSGMTHEIDLLRRAGAPDRAELPADAGPALRGWRALCDELGVDVIIDVVAGTSAGGINGAVLASAVAAGNPLPSLKELWVEAAQLSRGKLLRGSGRGPLPSLLDGAYFTGQLRGLFDRALRGGGRPAAHPVTLLTTATALGEQDTVWSDSTGCQFAVPDHRRVYRFRHDPGAVLFQPPAGELPEDPFTLFTPADPGQLTAAAAADLALAARATAGFPGAFEPVAEAGLGAYRVRCETDIRRRGDSDIGRREGDDITRRGGDGDDAGGPGDSDGAVLIDGGVLDNTPFEPLMTEIWRRPVESDWRRVIGYVTAGDGLDHATVATRDGSGGRRLDTDWFPVLTSAMRMGSESSFRNGVDALARRSAEAERQVRGTEELFTEALRDPGKARAAVDALYPLYRRNRIESGLLDAYQAHTGELAARPLCTPSLSGVAPDRAPRWVPPADFDRACDLTGEWRWGTVVADRTIRLLIRDLRVRAAGTPALDDTLRSLSRVLTAVIAVRDHIATLVVTAEDDDAETLLRAVNDAAAASSSPAVLGALLRAAADGYLAGAGVDAGPGDVLRAALMAEVLASAAGGDGPFRRMSRFDVLRMGPDVSSPLVEPRRPLGAWKLYGTQLRHFGAFARPEWRVADFVWGRLDGAAHLIGVLLRRGDDPLPDHAAGLVRAVQEAVLAEEDAVAADLSAALQAVDELDTRATLDLIRSTPSGRAIARDTVTDVLRMLTVRGAGTPSALSSAGSWLAGVLSRRSPPGRPPAWWLKPPLRLVTAWWPRRRFWDWVYGRDGRQ
ncbi:DUF3376 domain-containing protein [Actinoplanes utahensis]|uniref:DUF3376 domain-containing protein n=1 Tax=Actinoplanes utahensis TaxID=1869 RepID=UPI0019506BF0|nr:DUF3376 domain-containing protein [Actinoplanes utahensis]GIF27098.1 hypothetical protein Aut01nite_00840 [Actinoplanes utahensis]